MESKEEKNVQTSTQEDLLGIYPNRAYRRAKKKLGVDIPTPVWNPDIVTLGLGGKRYYRMPQGNLKKIKHIGGEK